MNAAIITLTLALGVFAGSALALPFWHLTRKLKRRCYGRGFCATGLECVENRECAVPLYAFPSASLTNDTYLPISAIQGRGTVSPYEGQEVKTMGIVTAIYRNQSYYVQDLYRDADPLTSEAIYSFRPTLAAGSAVPSVGDVVALGGKIVEYARGGYDLPLTEFLFGTISVLKPGVKVSVTPVVFRPPDTVSRNGSYNQSSEQFIWHDMVSPNYVCSSVYESAICYSEAHEGMLVVVKNGVTSDPERRFGEVGVVSCHSPQRKALRSCARFPTLTSTNFHGRVMAVEDDLFSKADRDLKLGTPLNDFHAVVSYSFGLYKLFNVEALTASARPLLRHHKPRRCRQYRTRPAAGLVRVAVWNVLNLDPKDPAYTLERVAKDIAHYQNCPDVVALQEVGDNDGPTRSNVTAADVTLDKIVTHLKNKSNCGVDYTYTDIAPNNLADGGLSGENIRVAFLYRSDKLELLPGVPKGDANTSTRWDSGHQRLTLNPGRVDVDAFDGSRKPIAAQFRFKLNSDRRYNMLTSTRKRKNINRNMNRRYGKSLIIVNNHWSSKFGDDPVFGRRQPPYQASQVKRTEQMNAVRSFVKSIPWKYPVMVVGDLNDFHFSTPVKGLQMFNLWNKVSASKRFSYNYQHRYQTLDHILIRKWAFRCSDFCPVHTSTLQSYYSGDSVSDHDALVAVCKVL